MKSLLVAFFLLFALSISAQTIKSGEFSADYTKAGFSLHENKGTRTFDMDINFDKSFGEMPNVFVSVTTVDADVKDNVRFKVEARGQSRDGFTIKVTTWGESKIFGIGGNWLAYSK